MYTTTQMAAMFGITPQTAKRWTAEFAKYLSVSATPEPGHVRKFTDNDLEVFALVAEEKARNRTFEDIHFALSSGQRGIVPDTSTALTIPTDGNEIALQSRITDLQTQLDQERALRHKAEGQVELLEKQLEKLQERLFKREW